MLVQDMTLSVCLWYFLQVVVHSHLSLQWQSQTSQRWHLNMNEEPSFQQDYLWKERKKHFQRFRCWSRTPNNHQPCFCLVLSSCIFKKEFHILKRHQLCNFWVSAVLNITRDWLRIVLLIFGSRHLLEQWSRHLSKKLDLRISELHLACVRHGDF